MERDCRSQVKKYLRVPYQQPLKFNLFLIYQKLKSSVNQTLIACRNKSLAGIGLNFRLIVNCSFHFCAQFIIIRYICSISDIVQTARKLFLLWFSVSQFQKFWACQSHVFKLCISLTPSQIIRSGWKINALIDLKNADQLFCYSLGEFNQWLYSSHLLGTCLLLTCILLPKFLRLDSCMTRSVD